MEDFTFPATATAAEPADTLCLHHHHQHRRLPSPHFASSPLWFPDAGVRVAPTPVAVVSRRTVDDDMEEQEATSSDAGRRSDAERGGGGEDDDDDEVVDVLRGAVGGAGEEKMDMLWENFNEELEALRHTGPCSKAAWGLHELSDTESEAAERGRGCAPMLRASSRAGATGQYYRRTGGSWVLLMRIFKRLFVVEKTVSAAGRHRQAKAAAQ